MKATAAGLVVIVIAAFALYAPHLDYVPPYLHDAEVQFALHARAIAATGHDANGRWLPVYFQMPDIGDNVWFHPVIVYWTAPLLLILPFSETTVRLASVLLGCVNIALMFFVARALFKSAFAGALAAVLLLLTPAHFIHSRVAMDYLHPVPFILAWTWLLLLFDHRRRVTYLYAAAALLGLGIYSYIASVAMMPVYLATTLVYARWHARVSWHHIIGMAAVFVALLLPAMLWLSLHPAVIAETMVRYSSGSSSPSIVGVALRVQELFSYTRVQEFISVYWDYFNPAYLFFAGGSNYMNSTRRAGVFLLTFAALLAAGVFDAVTRSRTPISLVLLAGFLTAPLAATAVGERYAIDRHLGTLPFAVLLAVYGWHAFIRARHRLVKAAAVVLVALMPLEFASFYRDYMGEYRVRAAGAFEFNIRGAAEEMIANAPEDASFYLSSKIPYARVYWRFYLAKAGVPWYDDKTHVIDATADMARQAPDDSLFMAHVDDDDLASLAREGELRVIQVVPELGRDSLFVIYERQ